MSFLLSGMCDNQRFRMSFALLAGIVNLVSVPLENTNCAEHELVSSGARGGGCGGRGLVLASFLALGTRSQPCAYEAKETVKMQEKNEKKMMQEQQKNTKKMMHREEKKLGKT
jgi:hypothetical protein